jgi:hypothetical protein
MERSPLPPTLLLGTFKSFGSLAGKDDGEYRHNSRTYWRETNRNDDRARRRIGVTAAAACSPSSSRRSPSLLLLLVASSLSVVVDLT